MIENKIADPLDMALVVDRLGSLVAVGFAVVDIDTRKGEPARSLGVVGKRLRLNSWIFCVVGAVTSTVAPSTNLP